MRAVHRLNRLIRPDAAVILGDLVNDGSGSDADRLFGDLARILDRLACPWFAVPGNHDCDAGRFAEYFGPLPEWLDIEGVRLIPFVDPEEPGYNARRLSEDLERMTTAGRNAPGPVVALQHVPLFPAGRSQCPYNYVNSEAVIRAMRSAGIGVSVGGHYHAGFDPIQEDGLVFAACPALCEFPFRFLVLEIDPGGVEARVESLSMDSALGLVDTHIHTQFAYCSENMDILRVLELAPLFGVADVRFAEHSGHLYFSRPDYSRCWEWGIGQASVSDCRMEEYLARLRDAGWPDAKFGIEVDCCFDGSSLLRQGDRERFPFRVGAMHSLPSTAGGKQPDEATLRTEFLGILERFLGDGMQVLAHPFRVFRRSGVEIPAALFGPTVTLLRRNGVAAEVNFHTNEPPREFVAMCLEQGVPLTFGSDAHNLYEIGAFALHLDLLRRCGVTGPPAPYLLPMPE
jgi:histidinol phosphatase-like PHP family hydrolase